MVRFTRDSQHTQHGEEMLAALTAFLAPYREGGGGLR
jgi:hypothetical protein